MSVNKVNVVAIDGPAGSGKSTVARRVAAALNYLYIDTGAMYRALTLKAVTQGLDLGDGKALEGLSSRTEIILKDDQGALKVFLDGVDVSNRIRDLDISEKVKYIAGVEGVRANMVKLQRKLGLEAKGSAMEGRDIGTVVFPDAKFKFYLDADFNERVERRFKELKEKGNDCLVDDVAKDLKARDRSDMSRSVGPLKQADDAIRIDTTGMTIDDVTDSILRKVQGCRS